MSDEYTIHGRFLMDKVGEDWYWAKLAQVHAREEEAEEFQAQASRFVRAKAFTVPLEDGRSAGVQAVPRPAPFNEERSPA